MDEIDLLRMVHVTSAVLLVGNVTVTGFWAAFLYRQHSFVPFRQVVRAIMWTDLLFTVGGGIGLTVSGYLLLKARTLVIMDTPWLFRGILILAGTMLAWLILLLPDQFRMTRLIMGDESRLRRLFFRWSLVGWTATGALFWALWGMVTRR